VSIVADLHNHSHASDGSLSPRELVDLASSRGLQALALTDHDTLSGYPTPSGTPAHGISVS
jgi:predicted metal-dependent phosphoesterase TrpH